MTGGRLDEYVRGRPSPPLRPLVAGYTGYRQDGGAPVVHRGLPSPYLTVVLTLDEPLQVTAHPDPRQSPGRYATLLGGLHLRPALLRHDGTQAGVQLAVHPTAARLLFGLPAAELAGVDAPLDAVLGAAATARLRERLAAAADWPGRFAVLDAALLRLAADRAAGPRGAVHPAVAGAYAALLRTGGAAGGPALAAAAGWSTRQLTVRFRAELGLGVKQTARVVRFDRARRRLAPGVRLAALAAATGYADQSHLAREFRALAGLPPSAWLAAEGGIGNVQAGPGAGRDDGAHG